MTPRPDRLRTFKHPDGIKGSALVFVAIAMMIMGLLTTGFLYSFKKVTRETQEELTITRMNQVVRALSIYLQKTGRLPCPANPDTTDTNPPFGAERGSGSSGTGAGVCITTASLVGIVPFKTLGLPEALVKDAWGSYFTYHISPQAVYTAAMAASYIAANRNTKAHDVCRVKDVWLDRGGADTWYPQQLLACCMQPGTGSQITVKDQSGNNASGNAVPYYASDYQPQHANAPAPSISHTQLSSPPAMVLVSHGMNRAGSYTGRGTSARMSTTGITANELENTDGTTDSDYIMMPRTEAPLSYFDDIVITKTLTGVYNEVGNKSTGMCNFRPGCPPVPVASAFTNAWTPSPITDLSGVACP